MPNKVICFGEALIDFVPEEKGLALRDVSHFKKACGGAPANVAAAVAQQNCPALMLSQVGDDAFGDFIVETLRGQGVDTRHILRTDKAHTALAFVSIAASGERSFVFYRHPSADMLYGPESVPDSVFQSNDIFHFGSVDLVKGPMREAHRLAVKKAQEKGLIVSFDPNLRFNLWDDKDDLKAIIREFIPLCHLIKVSIDELPFITSQASEAAGVHYLFQGAVKLVLVTYGSQGSTLYFKKGSIHQEAYRCSVKDTTGAGDSFLGGFLSQILGKVKVETLGEPLPLYQNALAYGSALSSLVCEQYGALPMPSLSAVEERLKRGR